MRVKARKATSAYKLELLEQKPEILHRAMMSLAEAIIRRDLDQEKVRTAKLARAIGESMCLADLLGRRRVLVEAHALARRKQPAQFRMADLASPRSRGPGGGIARFAAVPDLTFSEAVDDIVSRTPMLVKHADEVRDAYGVGKHGFALLKLPQGLADQARMTLTRRIQALLASYLNRGETEQTVREQLSAVGGFSQGYASTVFRTNLANAFTAGRFKQLRDPEVADIVPALELVGVHDSDERKNHKDGVGFTAGLDHPEWNRISPPLGFNCRHDLRSVDRWELKSRGLLRSGGHVTPHYPSTFSGCHPDAGFRHQRPDLSVYGGA